MERAERGENVPRERKEWAAGESGWAVERGRGKPGWAERGEREACCGLGLKLGWAALGFLFF